MPSIIVKFSFYKRLFEKYRSDLFSFFSQHVSVRREDIILDIGGPSKGFENLCASCRCIAVNLNLDLKNPKWEHVLADARYLPFKDKSLTFCISNSVVEHIPDGLPSFAREITRVMSKGYFISFPYYYTLLEPHYFVPFFQFVPRKIKRFLIWDLGLTLGQIGRENFELVELPKPSEIKFFFPKANKKILMLFVLPWDTVIYSFNSC